MSNLEKIRAERSGIADQIAALKRRDADLAVTERVIAEFEGVKIDPPQPMLASVVLGLTRPSRRERIVDILTNSADRWMTSAEINKALFASGGMIKTTSFYPMLTTLKNEGVIVRVADKMALRSRLTREEADLIGA